MVCKQTLSISALAISMLAAASATADRAAVGDPSLREFLEWFEDGTRRFMNGDTALEIALVADLCVLFQKLPPYPDVLHPMHGGIGLLDKRPGNSWESMEAPPEFVADQTANGNILDRIRRTKEPHHGRAVLVRF